MSRDGSGNYTLPSNSFNPAVSGTAIDESDWNDTAADLETAVTGSIAADGQTPTTAVIPFANGIQTDTIAENTGAAGVTVDGVLLKDTGVTTNTLKVNGADIVLEGATANEFETTISVTDPTADRTITIPDSTGTIMLNIVTTRGDIIRGDSSGNVERLAIGAANKVLVSDGTDIAYGDVTGPSIVIGSDAEGDILFRNGSSYTRLALGTAGQTLQVNAGATAPEWGGSTTDYLLYQDRQTSGTNGPTYTANQWNKVQMSTEVTDTGNNGSLASDVMTLDAGTYEAWGWASCSIASTSNNKQRLRLRDTTGTATLLIGNTTGAQESGGQNITVSPSIVGHFTLGAQSACELQIWPDVVSTTTLAAMTTGEQEVYASLYLRKIA